MSAEDRVRLVGVDYVDVRGDVHLHCTVVLEVRTPGDRRATRTASWAMQVFSATGALMTDASLGLSRERHPTVGHVLDHWAKGGLHARHGALALAEALPGGAASRGAKPSGAALTRVWPGALGLRSAVSAARLASRRDAGELAVAALPRVDAAMAGAWQRPLKAARVEAMLWGTCVGDALGAPLEGMPLAERAHRHGRVTGLVDCKRTRRPAGSVTSDSQMALRLFGSLGQQGHADSVAIVRSWTDPLPLVDAGAATRAFLMAAQGVSDADTLWGLRQRGAAGNGALMRVAGVVAAHGWSGRVGPGLMWDVVETSALTHDSATSTACCVGWAALLVHLMQCDEGARVSAQELFDVFLEHARPVEGTPGLCTRTVPPEDVGSVCDVVERHVVQAHRQGTDQVFRREWYSGAYLLETLPQALSLLARYLDDPVGGILAAVNQTVDSDTIASLVAGAMGARHGMDALPREWLEGVHRAALVHAGQLNALDSGEAETLSVGSSYVTDSPAHALAAWQARWPLGPGQTA